MRKLLDDKAPIEEIETRTRELEAIMQDLGNASVGESPTDADEAEVIDAEFDEN